MKEFSVLISVYQKDNPFFFEQALRSIFDQSLLPTEVILVKDGPIEEGLTNVINNFKRKHASIKVIELEENKGLGIALNEGLENCSNEIVARMDADDINKPWRFQKEYEFLQSNPDIVLVGSWIDEFIGSPDNVQGQRKVPEHPDKISVFAKLRSPFNHPTVMFRKSAILAVGSYQSFGTFEDYHLWSRLLSAGYKTYNLQESLLYFRISADMYNRRGGWVKTKQEFNLQSYFLKTGFINRFCFMRNLFIRGLFRAAPSEIRAFFYRRKF